MTDKKGKKVTRKLADIETGELIEIYEGDRISIISEEQRKAIQKSVKNKELNEEVKDWNKQLGGFIFVLFKYCNLIMEEYEEITPQDITKLFYLATYVDYDGYLIYEDDYMTKSKMMELLNIKQRKFDDFFKKMTNIKIFIYKNKIIKINTSYFMKGEITKDIQINNNYTRVYINSIRFLYDNVRISQHSQLGMYFKIIPYIHRQKNVLCHNPDCFEEDIQLMNANELKDKIGYHRNGVRKFINTLLGTKLKNGESILVTVRNDPDEGKSFIMVNPKVIYGGNFGLRNGRETVTKWFSPKKEKE